jgi:hypothetical protein
MCKAENYLSCFDVHYLLCIIMFVFCVLCLIFYVLDVSQFLSPDAIVQLWPTTKTQGVKNSISHNQYFS